MPYNGKEAIQKQSWKNLFENVLGITSSYPYSTEPSAYELCKTRAHENALAAVGWYFRKVNNKI